MATHLSLPGATILLLRGWGKVAKPDQNDHRVDLRDPGQFVVSRSTMLGEKPVLSIPITQLRLGSYTKQITSGGGWIGGGFGITGAMLGAYQAQLLNRLTTHTREYTPSSLVEITGGCVSVVWAASPLRRGARKARPRRARRAAGSAESRGIES
jgi:hypothetical protein